MTKDELIITSEDLNDIFGMEMSKDKAPSGKKSAPQEAENKTAAEKPVEKKSIVIQSKFAELDNAAKGAAKKPEAASVDEFLKRGQLVQKEAGGNKAGETVLEMKKENEAELKFTGGILEIFEEVRRAMASELEAVLDKKVVNNMLLRTLEKAALSFEVLKGTCLDKEGNTREDGVIDKERFYKNLPQISNDTAAVEKSAASALYWVLYLRLKSIKLGLGKEKYSAVCEKLTKKMSVIEAGYKPGTIRTIKDKILMPAIKKGDE